MVNTVIEHERMIPARQDTIWNIVRDITQNPIWHADCDDIRFLSSKQNGIGTRWRNFSEDGQEYVVEIKAWYEGLGFEYMIMDGVPYSSNKGRIRIREAPEGTVVQWTFAYEMSGLFSGLRNNLSVRRQIDADILDSLENLNNYVCTLRTEMFDQDQSRASMQAAPDASARSSYQPRHPSAVDDDRMNPHNQLPRPLPEAETSPYIATESPAEEYQPPISRYAPPTDISMGAPPQDTQAQDSAPASSFSPPEPPYDPSDTRPNRRTQDIEALPSGPRAIPEPIASSTVRATPQFILDEPPITKDDTQPTGTQSEAVESTKLDRQSEQDPEAEPMAQSPVIEETPPPENPVSTPNSAEWQSADDDVTSTSRSTERQQRAEELSIFERFGLPKPSEAAIEQTRLERPRLAQLEEEQSVDLIIPLPLANRMGLRAKMRARKQIVRRA